ncbi:hypothetical protein CAEBREN_09900 [Caenorhabditis brenneri]|uniref:Uncharacterized protein n=1 Tax=Caenorhabditis brenneri TaxID=135651 RepID=G0NIU5_CAEBE|nr:hypothetical protein CAEBREN_09900 [Caenorhabditis brenneri]
MSERLKYVKNGVCRIENFAECLATRSFPTERHWMIGDAEWWSRLKISRNRTEIFLDTWCSSAMKRSIRTYSRVLSNLNRDEKRFEITKSEIIHSFNHSVGFSLLKNQSQPIGNTVTVRGSHEELSVFPLVLQIAHGVQFKSELVYLYRVISMASKQGMRNVIHYCDVLLTQTQEHSGFKAVDRYWIHFAIEYNLKRWMVQLLKTMKSVKDCIEGEDVEKMSNDTMKMFIAKFLYEKF